MNAYKLFLQKNGLKQVQLADYLGVTESAISNVVKNKANLSEENLIKIIGNEKGWDVSMLKGIGVSASKNSDPVQDISLMDIIKSQQKTIELQAKTIELQTQMLEQADREKRSSDVRENGPAGCADAVGQ